jgi:hypothetical protein
VTPLIIKKLKPEEKVNIAISMTDVCTHVCADAIKDQAGAIKEEELIEQVRERIMYQKRHHREV